MLSTSSQNTLLLIARVLFAGIFVFSGWGKIMGFAATLAYIQSAGITFFPVGLLTLAIIFEFGGGLLVLFGWHTRLGAAALFIFTLLTSFLIHHFWSYPPEAAQLQMIQFMKNIAILGGALYIFCFGAGGFSLDAKQRRS